MISADGFLQLLEAYRNFYAYPSAHRVSGRDRSALANYTHSSDVYLAIRVSLPMIFIPKRSNLYILCCRR